MNAIAWINDVVGKPWEDRSDGPDSYDCWGLVIDSFSRIDGNPLNEVDGYASGAPIEVAGAAEELSGDWEECEGEHGAVFCVYNEVGSMVHVGRIFSIPKAGLYAIHSRGDGGQVQANRIGAIKRKYANLKFFRRL